MPSLEQLAELITAGENREAVRMAIELQSEGVTEEALINEGLTRAWESMDLKCTTGEFSLVEILLSGRAMYDVLNQVIRPKLNMSEQRVTSEYVTIVLGTIQGDIHDLGKKVVAGILSATGVNVVELGKDVPPEEFVKVAKAENAKFIGVSSLLTGTIPQIRKIRELVREAGLTSVEVIAGGAALSRVSAEHLNVDFVAADAMAGWRYIRQKIGGSTDAR